ncbi:MAG: glutamine--fructose-6-phosphate transaminase (isomerizing) [Candidatus Njordarchaeia archaeon]
MCGIGGFLKVKGEKKVTSIIIRMLENLEYRGYDSAGIAVIAGEEIVVEKDVGKISQIKKVLENIDLNTHIGIGHTRWATHGVVSKENAHPHTDCGKKIALVHNGTIENFIQLKKMLLERGHRFSSETDTEVIVHLVEEEYRKEKNNFFQAFKNTIKKLEGSFAIGLITTYEPDKIYFAKHQSPLVIGVSDEGFFLASDVPAFLEFTNKVIYLEDWDVGEITPRGVYIENIIDGKIKEPIIETVPWGVEAAKKGGFPHYMIKEIFEQPEVITAAQSSPIEAVKLFARSVDEAEIVYLVAAGTSYHASLVGQTLLREFGVPAQAIISSEFIDKVGKSVSKDTFVIGVSQSGETADTLTALKYAKEKGALIGALTNVMGSAITRLADKVLYLNAGPEIGVAATKTYTSQIVVLTLLSYVIGLERGYDLENEYNYFKNALSKDVGRVIKEVDSVCKGIAIEVKNFEDAYFITDVFNLPTALEGSLKLKEISYIHSEGMEISYFYRHVWPNFRHPYITVVIGEEAAKRYLNMVNGHEDGPTYTILISHKEHKDGDVIDKEIVIDSQVPKRLRFIIDILPLQLLAYYTAVERGYDPDKPRNLAKSVTVE